MSLSLKLRSFSVAWTLALAFPLAAAEFPKGVKVPAGFEATLFAAPPNVGYPTCVAAAPTGEVFVGVDENGSIDAKPGRGRVVRCVDTNGDGTADEFKIFAEMDSPRGIWFDRDTLYVMHPPLVSAFVDADGDGVSDRSEVLVRGLGFDLKFRGADHTVNGMRMGIDGFLYIAVGDYGATNAVGKDGAKIQLWDGGVVRVRPDGTGLEIVSTGQRNIYDVAVSPEGDLFTRDNTNDGGGWDVRLSHVLLGGEYGYPRLFKNSPEEIVQPLAEYGGGSPCGALFMDEPFFAKEIGTALYTCEWGRNKIYRHPLTNDGASFHAGQVEFMDLPRAVDMDVDGSGRLYVASWAGGGFTYTGPNVGYVLRVVPQGLEATAFPNLAKATGAELVEHLKSASAVRRLHAQRELLRRSDKGALVKPLENMAASNASRGVRAAAIFTLAQFNSEAARAALVRLAKESATREFALRALGDHATAAATVPTEPFVAALRDSDARVRLQAASALGRLGKRESASALLPLVADADPRVAHVAVHALVSLRAADVCLQALDSAGLANVVPGAMRVLQRLHEPAVVSGLLTRLETTTDATLRRAMLKGLARLYNREADWDGKWWGTRPDTTGPYYKPVKWAESERIGAALRQELAAANAEMLRWLVVELQKNRVDLPELTGVALKLAREDEAFKAVAVELFATRSSLPDEAIPLFGDVAKAESQPVALRAKAVRVLQRASAKADARDAAIAALTTPEKLSGELNNAWEDFARDTRHAGSIERFRELAEDGSASARTLGYAVLVHLSTQRLSSKEARVAAERAVEQAWSKPDALVPLLKAVTRMRANAYALQVGSLLKDSRPDVAQAAKAADEAIGRRKGNKTDEPLIEKLDYHELMARVMKEKGDAKAGRDLFTRAGCAACHTATADEPLKGPYLGGIAARYSRPELCESIIKPNEKIAQGFETQWFKLKDDEEVEGFVTREGGDDLDVRNIAGITTTVAKKDIVERGKREISAMPPGLVDKLTPGELASLLAFLESLKSK